MPFQTNLCRILLYMTIENTQFEVRLTLTLFQGYGNILFNRQFSRGCNSKKDAIVNTPNTTL